MESSHYEPLLVYNSEPLGLSGEHGGNQYYQLKIAEVLEAYKKNFLLLLP
jgi:hypothetical protein